MILGYGYAKDKGSTKVIKMSFLNNLTTNLFKMQRRIFYVLMEIWGLFPSPTGRVIIMLA